LTYLKINETGELNVKHIRLMGGSYTWREKIKMGGQGGPKLLYKGGIDYFDEMDGNAIHEVGYANFELLKKGFVSRISRFPMIRSIGILFDEVHKIFIEGQRVHVTYNRFGTKVSKIMHQCDLKIVMKSNDTYAFKMEPKDLDKVIGFFERSALKDRISFASKLEKPIEEKSHFLLHLRDFIGLNSNNIFH